MSLSHALFYVKKKYFKGFAVKMLLETYFVLEDWVSKSSTNLGLSYNKNPPATHNTYYNLKVQFRRSEDVPPAVALYPKSHIDVKSQVGLVFITHVKPMYDSSY